MAAFQKIVNLFRKRNDEWTVEKGGEEQTLSREAINGYGQPAGNKHVHREYKNSVRNPENRGMFDEKKAPFTEVVAAQEKLALEQQRQRIRDEILNDCEVSKLYKKPQGIMDLNAKNNISMSGLCDAGGRTHPNETNEFDTCGKSKDVYNSFGVKIGSNTSSRDADCKLAPDQGAHFRTIIGRQRDDQGNSHMVIEDRQPNPTLVHLREGSVVGETLTQFHMLQGLRDERNCARYGYQCGY